MVILVNKKRAVWLIMLVVIAVAALFLYKPCLRKYVYPEPYLEYVTGAAEKYGLSPHLIYAVMKAESGFNSQAVSAKGACGLMQITPETAEWAAEKMGINEKPDLFSPAENIEVGSWYLSYLKMEFGEETAALAAYNAGPANVRGWMTEKGSIDAENIPFVETRDYITKTMKFYEMYKKLYPEGE